MTIRCYTLSVMTFLMIGVARACIVPSPVMEPGCSTVSSSVFWIRSSVCAWRHACVKRFTTVRTPCVSMACVLPAIQRWLSWVQVMHPKRIVSTCFEGEHENLRGTKRTCRHARCLAKIGHCISRLLRLLHKLAISCILSVEAEDRPKLASQHLCLANDALTPPEKRREAQPVEAGQASRLRLKRGVIRRLAGCAFELRQGRHLG